MTSQITACGSDLADAALSTGDIQICAKCGLVAVPDVVIIQGHANGEEIWDAGHLRNADSREVWIYDGDEVLLTDWMFRLWEVSQ